MKITNLMYHGQFEFAEKEDYSEIYGVAFRSGRIEDKKVFIDESELKPIADSMTDIPLIDSHQKETIKSTVGKVLKGFVDQKFVKYVAHVMDAQAIDLIKKGLVKGVSVGLAYEREEVLENNYIKLSGLKCRELSLTNFPAIVEATINYGEFSLDVEDDIQPEDYDYNKTVDNLTKLAYDELRTKYDALKELYEEQLTQNAQLNNEAQKLHKAYEYLKVYKEELPDKYLEFDEETVMLYGELMQDVRNATKTLGAAADEDVIADSKTEAKEALKDMIFKRDGKNDSKIKTWKEFKKKFDLSDNK